MSIGILDKFNNAVCVTKQLLTPQEAFNKIHEKLIEMSPPEEYTSETLDYKILKNLNDEKKMSFMCVPDDITGVPWQFLALNNNPAYTKFFKFAYIKNPDEEAAKRLDIKLQNFPIFSLGFHQKKEHNADQHYSVRSYYTLGVGMAYDKLEQIIQQVKFDVNNNIGYRRKTRLDKRI